MPNQDHNPAELRKQVGVLRAEIARMKILINAQDRIFVRRGSSMNPVITELFPDPNSETIHETKNDLLAALLEWALSAGYVEVTLPDGQWDFSDADQSGHLLTCGVF